MKFKFQIFEKFKLEIITFISGAVVMVLEIVGSRILSPYLGNSIFIWSSLIGVILGSLSLGNWFGGFISDKKASLKVLSSILFYSSIAIFILTIIKDIILFIVADKLEITQASILLGIILFAPSSIFLGMVSPYVIKLKLKDLKTSGETVGFLYALSTMGSIFGTFLAGFILISYVGTNGVLILLSVILVFLALFADSEFWVGRKLVAILVLIISIYQIKGQEDSLKNTGYIDKDTNYNRVIIYESIDKTTGRPVRALSQDRQSSSAMFLDGDDLVYEYTKYYNLFSHFKPDFKNTLMIGGAAYSYPKEFLKKYPDSNIDVVEIDPEITSLAVKYFNLKEDENLKIIHQDGRVFLNQNEMKYDVIFGDAFSSLHTVPFHLTTLECVKKIYDSLVVDGVYIANVISAVNGDKSDFFQSEFRTISEVFPQVLVFRVKDVGLSENQNLILVALKTKKEFSKVSEDNEINSYLSRQYDYKNDKQGLILTDDFAPVERFSLKTLSF